MATDDTLTYLYGVVRQADVRSVSLDGGDCGLVGVAGAAVRLDRVGELSAVVSAAPAADFADRELNERLSDLNWLASTARAHDAVVTALSERVTVLPLRLCTVLRGTERVRETLVARNAYFAELLSRLAGHVEYGVKVYVGEHADAPSAPASAPSAESDAGDEASSPGRAYLRQRRARLQGRSAARTRGVELAARIDRAVSTLVADRREHLPQDGRLSGTPGVNVGNAAYLVPRERQAMFQRLVSQVAAGRNEAWVEVTGPWAPYSFAVMTDEPAAADLAGAE
jgi:hypothetical protein